MRGHASVASLSYWPAMTFAHVCRTPTGGEARGVQWEDGWPADGAAKGGAGRAASAGRGKDAAMAPRDLRLTAAAAAEARRVRIK